MRNLRVEYVPFVRVRPAHALIGGLVTLGAIGTTDWMIKSDLSVSTLYLVPISSIAWLVNRRAALAMVLLAAIVWFAAEYFGRPGSELSAVAWQALSRLIFFAIVALLVDRIRQLMLNLDQLVRDRTAALEFEVARRRQLETESGEIADREQERISQELHDQLAGYLSGLAFRAASLQDALENGVRPDPVQARELVTALNQATNQVRNLARFLAPVHEDGDLGTALSRLAAETETTFGIACLVDVPRKLPALTKVQTTQLCRIAQEAVRNSIQHGETEVIHITVWSDLTRVKLEVSNDGLPWRGPVSQGSGLGVRIMHHRTAKLGGILSINPGNGGGTVVSCSIPTQLPNADIGEDRAKEIS